MNLVDSCGWLEYYADGPNADFYAGAIEDTDNLIVPVICIYEVFKKILQQRGEAPALQAVALMHQGLVVDLSSPLALSAAKIGADMKLPLADSIILATARAHNATVWTQDAHFKDIEGVRYVEKEIKNR
ncbi:MAG: tRNA(fMet)-specific endonuclease VapC [Syntrophorhabdus sp. PtaB.Bin047]|jgi:predicted nucleic acid-binding protein|nr:MAG: tRNA(fMet)-specific endonuclease VapC [Syntrophorhabdus sp. PtaB.Bin047]